MFTPWPSPPTGTPSPRGPRIKRCGCGGMVCVGVGTGGCGRVEGLMLSSLPSPPQPCIPILTLTTPRSAWGARCPYPPPPPPLLFLRLTLHPPPCSEAWDKHQRLLLLQEVLPLSPCALGGGRGGSPSARTYLCARLRTPNRGHVAACSGNGAMHFGCVLQSLSAGAVPLSLPPPPTPLPFRPPPAGVCLWPEACTQHLSARTTQHAAPLGPLLHEPMTRSAPRG